MESTGEFLLDQFFSGTEEATIDEKGRLLFCKEKRELLADNFVMVHDPSGCIAVYPRAKMEEIVQQFNRANILNEGRAQFARMLAAKMVKGLKFDRQGRVVVPKQLRDAAGISGEVRIEGAFDKVEIWDRERREEFDESLTKHGETRGDIYRWSYCEMMSSVEDKE